MFKLPENVIMCQKLRNESLTVGELTEGIANEAIIGIEMKIPKLLVKIGLAETTSEARRLIRGGAVSLGVDKVRITSEDQTVIFLMRAE